MTYSHFLFTLLSLVIVLKYSEINFKNLFTYNKDFYSHLSIKNSEYFNLYLKRIFNTKQELPIPEIFLFIMISLNTIDFNLYNIHLQLITLYFLFLIVPFFIIYNMFYLRSYKESLLLKIPFVSYIENAFSKIKYDSIHKVEISDEEFNNLESCKFNFNSEEYEDYINTFNEVIEYLKIYDLKPLDKSEFLEKIIYMKYSIIVRNESSLYRIIYDEDLIELELMSFDNAEIYKYMNTNTLTSEKKYNYYTYFVFILTFKEIILL